jgi:hypothetical protein
MVRVGFAALALASMLSVPAALAGEHEGVSLPDNVTVDGKTLTLNGLGTRKATFLKVKVYVAGLYLEKPSSDARAILASPEAKRLVLHFVRHAKRGDIVKAWEEGFEKSAPAEAAALRPRIEKLNGWMSDFHEGQTLTFTFSPGRGVVVDVNGKERGVIPGDDFSRALLGIWLGPSPPNPELKTGLLGRH